MYSVIKKAGFEMAHKLTTSFATECQSIHGHSYTLEVLIETENLNKDGMVIDLKLLGDVIQKYIIDAIDHKCLIFQDDPIFPGLQGLQRDLVVPMPYNPTAENMAKNIHDILYKELELRMPRWHSLTIRLHETATGSVEYKRSC